MSRQSASSSRVLVLVPARGGSKGIPGKNLQTVDGVSLVGRAVLCALRFRREARLPDARIVVDTDSQEIADEAREWGAEAPFLRPPELAQDGTTTLASTLHLVQRLTTAGWAPEVIVLLQPTSPLRSWRDVATCFHRFADGGHESVITVVEPSKPPQLAMRTSESGLLDWLAAAPPANVRRQDLARAVSPSGAVYVTTVAALRTRQAFVVPGVTVGVECGRTPSLDVDTQEDLVAARRAAVLSVPRKPVCVTTLKTLPDLGGVVTLNDGRRFHVHVASDLPRVMQAAPAAGGVALLPAQDSKRRPENSLREAPGALSWREALGVDVALICESEEQLGAHALSLGAYDLLLLPQDQPRLESLARTILLATAPLRS